MKKIILLILIPLFITGCEAVYTIEINDDTFKEILEINNKNPETWGEDEWSYEDQIIQHREMHIPTDVRGDLDTDEYVPGTIYYKKESINTNDNLGLRLSNPFNGMEEYAESTIANMNVGNFGFTYFNGRLRFNDNIEHFSFQTYPLLTNLTIRVITEYEMFKHNADEVKDGVYYWHLTKDNYEDKKIEIEIILDDNPFGDEEEDWLSREMLIIIYVSLILIGVLIVGPIIYFKVKNSNR